MKNLALFVLIFSFIHVALFARGAAEEQAQAEIAGEWVLLITEFESASLSAWSALTPILVSRGLVDSLSLISYRVRLPQEYAHHEEAAWAAMRTEAAQALAASQNARSLLIFQGEPGWRHRQNLARLDAEIETRAAALKEVEENRPVASRQPEFSLAEANLNGVFPAPPAAGQEARFAQQQGAAAVLTGRIWTHHNWYVLNVRLFALYSRDFIFEEEIVFSPGNLENAMSELTGRLTAALSGEPTGAIAVAARPPSALVLINRSFAGVGTVQAAEFPFGQVTVEIAAEGYISEIVETEITPGALVTITADLRPVEHAEVHIFSEPGASVYAGALFVGEAPLTLRLPLNQLEYVTVFAPEPYEGIARAVFFTPESPHASMSLTMSLLPDQRGQGRVMRARRAHYNLWGLAWLTGIATWIVYGNSVSTGNAINFAGATGREVSPSLVNSNQRFSNMTMYLGAALIGVLVLDFVFLGRYLFIATQEAPRRL